MQLDGNRFKINLCTAIKEADIAFDEADVKFTITAIREHNVTYNSLDDYLHRWMINDKQLNNRYFTLDEVVAFLAHPDYKFPLWIKILLTDASEGHSVFELQISMRFRKPTQLKYIETGHPPFIFEKR